MNNLIENALHKLWSCVKCTIYKYNIKYLVLPIIYLIIILLVIPTPSTKISIVSFTKMDSYAVAVVDKDTKLKNILERYNLSEKEFKVLVGIVLSEAESNSYEDAYAVINTIYNRTNSKNWVRSVNNYFGKDKGRSLYYQAISPNQFTVYKSGRYLKYMNDTESIGYDAIIDFLYTENIMHNYLSFRSHNIKINGSECFSDKGNNYFNELKDENRI